MDYHGAIEEYERLVDVFQSAVTFERDAVNDLQKKYRAFQQEMIAHTCGDYPTTMLRVLSTSTGRDLSDLWHMANTRLIEATAKKQLAAYDIERFLSLIKTQFSVKEAVKDASS